MTMTFLVMVHLKQWELQAFSVHLAMMWILDDPSFESTSNPPHKLLTAELSSDWWLALNGFHQGFLQLESSLESQRPLEKVTLSISLGRILWNVVLHRNSILSCNCIVNLLNRIGLRICFKIKYVICSRHRSVTRVHPVCNLPSNFGFCFENFTITLHRLEVQCC